MRLNFGLKKPMVSCMHWFNNTYLHHFANLTHHIMYKLLATPEKLFDKSNRHIHF